MQIVRTIYQKLMAFRKTCLTIFFTVMMMNLMLAQTEKPGVKVQGRATQGTILLRWAPNTPTLWHFGNTYGYTIERYTMAVNNKLVDRPKKVILTNTPFKPAPQGQWERAMDDDDYVAVAAQAIFGETFELTDDYKSDIMQVVNKSRELESRFSFALFAADQSVAAAKLSGLYYEDQTVEPQTKYLYRIYANLPTNKVLADTGFVYIGIQDYQPLPQPVGLQAKFSDHQVLLSWNREIFENTYNSYWVERSDDDKKSFKKITKEPIINTSPGEKSNSPFVFKIDSLPDNNKEYHYRVLGINAFGEISPPSDTVSGSGKPVFGYSATITKGTVTREGYAEIEWSFPDQAAPLMQSFDLLRHDPVSKKHTEVLKGIDKNLRTVKDLSPQGTNYYVIRANDKYGRTNNSFPYLLQTEDSIPPLAPVEITGRIDTLGRVFISWKANTEEDLFGYNLYRANFSSDEFIQKPGPILLENQYIDTVNLNTLTEKIYYKLRAVDKRFNPSLFSTVLVLEKPDKIPPVPPVFKAIRSDSSGIVLAWNNSGSEDVMEHLLYRKAEYETEWTLIKTFTKTDSAATYRDRSVKHKVRYAYTLLAVDDDGLESVPATPLTIAYVANEPYPKIDNIFYIIDKEKKLITLSWKYEHELVDKFMIYRANNGQPMTLYKSVEAGVTELKDEYSLNDTKVEYRIVVGFKTGERTRWSEGVVVNF